MANLNKFPRVYNATSFGLTADLSLQPSQWNTVGSLTVPAGQEVAFGVGATVNGVDTREPAYIRIDNTTAGQIAGTFRLVVTNPTETKSIVVYEQRSARAGSDVNDKAKAWLIGEANIRAQRDSKLLIQFKPDSATAVTLTALDPDTSISMPVTVYYY